MSTQVHSPIGAGKSTNVSPALFSELYCRFNGFSLGAFLAGAQLNIAKSRYGALRQRIHEFLQEIHLEESLPTRHARYVGDFPKIFAHIHSRVRERSQQLYEFTGIGSMAILYAGSACHITRAARSSLRQRWTPVFERHSVPAEVFERFDLSIRREARSREAATLVSHAFALLSELLQPLPAEADTAFVAMPFRPPYIQYFCEYYRPALQQAGYRALRCWGGITSEEYYPFIAPLITRCGGVLAEISTHNLNVLNEIGLAHGCNRPVFLLQERRQPPPPSNLANLLILQYDERTWDGPRSDIKRLARFIALHRKQFIKSMTQEAVIRDTARQLLLYLQVARKAIPKGLRQLITC